MLGRVVGGRRRGGGEVGLVGCQYVLFYNESVSSVSRAGVTKTLISAHSGEGSTAHSAQKQGPKEGQKPHPPTPHAAVVLLVIGSLLLSDPAVDQAGFFGLVVIVTVKPRVALPVVGRQAAALPCWLALDGGLRWWRDEDSARSYAPQSRKAVQTRPSIPSPSSCVRRPCPHLVPGNTPTSTCLPSASIGGRKAARTRSACVGHL